MNKIPMTIVEYEDKGIDYIRFDFFPNSENINSIPPFPDDPDHVSITVLKNNTLCEFSISPRMLKAIKEYFNDKS